MSDNSEDPEVELWGRCRRCVLYWHMPVRTQSSRMVPVASFTAKRTALHHPTIMIVEDALSTLQKRSPTLHDLILETVMS